MNLGNDRFSKTSGDIERLLYNRNEMYSREFVQIDWEGLGMHSTSTAGDCRVCSVTL